VGDDAADLTGTGRLGLEPAPGGLSIAQDLLNTASVPTSGVADLLDDAAAARRSLVASVRLWAEQTGSDAPALELAEADLAALRALRAELRRWLAVPAETARHETTITVDLRAGDVAYQPGGGGADRIAGLVATELLIASRTGRLRRLKTCANHACGAAFYDGSPNASRVWHDVRTCGNAANLRASRARRRAPSA
jgi:predicted RNA-binding Zn ribbon-like protein